MAGNTTLANPVLVVRESLPRHIAELEEMLVRKIGEVMEIQRELAVARTLVSLTPPDTSKDKLPPAALVKE